MDGIALSDFRHVQRELSQYAGRNYSHRKAWVLERLQIQSRVFAIDICVCST